MKVVIGLFAGLIPVVPLLVFLTRRRRDHASLTRETVMGWGVLNLMAALVVVGLGLAWFFVPDIAQAAGLAQEQVAPDPMAYIGAAVAVAGGSVSAGYAVGAVGSAAVGTVAEKPEIFGRVLLFVGLAEGVAIYGLIIAFIMLG
jgi:V/A-type H+/Na+-transporting ATPase subunit K